MIAVGERKFYFNNGAELFSCLEEALYRMGIPRDLTSDPVFLDTVSHLQSQEYLTKLSEKNLPEQTLVQALGLIHGPDAIACLKEKTEGMLVDSTLRLREFYGPKGDILIPFSGGRDSSSLTFMTAALFPERRIYLATVLNGLEIKPHNARIQAELIADKLKRRGINPHFIHLYTDLSDLYDPFVITSAGEDRQTLGYPGICSGCKILMESNLAQVAKEYQLKHVPLGYNKFQAHQQWPEQHPAQMMVMRQFLKERFPDLNIGSPFYEILGGPIDSALFLAAFGFFPEEQKKEGGCIGRGTNPQQINTKRLADFVKVKTQSLPVNREITRLESSSIVHGPRYTDEMDRLKRHKKFMEAVYVSKGDVREIKAGN